MNNLNSMSDKLKGNWNVLKGKLQQQYADLTDDDVLYVEGKENELLGRLQKRLGKTKEEVNELIDRLSTTSADRVV
jgi:uncharacterized protein YjbJ (UPF0337 family)